MAKKFRAISGSVAVAAGGTGTIDLEEVTNRKMIIDEFAALITKSTYLQFHGGENEPVIIATVLQNDDVKIAPLVPLKSLSGAGEFSKMLSTVMSIQGNEKLSLQLSNPSAVDVIVYFSAIGHSEVA